MIWMNCLAGWTESAEQPDEAYVAKYAYDFESKQFSAVLKQLECVKPTLVFCVGEKSQESISTLLFQ